MVPHPLLRIAPGADHARFALKVSLAEALRGLGHAVLDLGTNGPDRVDYPDFGRAVAQAVLSGQAERGVLDVWSQALMVQSSPRRGGMRYATTRTPRGCRVPTTTPT